MAAIWVIVPALVLVGIYVTGRHPGTKTAQAAAQAYAAGLAAQSESQLRAIAGFSTPDIDHVIADDLRQLRGHTLAITKVSVASDPDSPPRASLQGTLDGRPFATKVYLSQTGGTVLGWKDGWHVMFNPVGPLNQAG
ncbi:hypothetical protein ACFUC1_08465 [Pedococcus sp. NPDC057267]|uniref:hypothetical protein n=1 Tax=Pedococcus sp. NPDC057267 TaxID=3346077 RepID=UPI00364579BD